MRLRYSIPILLAGLAQAQTRSPCNPTERDGCPNNPGSTESTISIDFTKTKALPADWITENQGKIEYTDKGANIIVAKSGDSMNLVSKSFFLFGSFEFKFRAAAGKGIASSADLLSYALDEIDFEAMSKAPGIIESAYFGHGDRTDYHQGGKHPAPGNQEKSHTYKIDWTPEYISWSINGNVVRTLRPDDAKGGTRYPQTPAQIKIGSWAPGDATKNEKGVIEWAEGPTDWSKGPFIMTLESVNIVNYTPAKSFSYGDKSGSYKSIKIEGGSLMSNAKGLGPAPEAPKKPETSAPPLSAPPSASATNIAAASTAAPHNDTSSAPAITLSRNTTTPSSTESPKPTANANGAASFLTSGSLLVVGALVVPAVLML